MEKTIDFDDRAISRLLPFKPKVGSKTRADEYSDARVSCLKLTVSEKGRKHWTYRYTYHSQKRSIAIGEFPATTTKAARDVALSYRAMLDRDVDPRIEKDRRRDMPTVQQFCSETYLPWAFANKKSADDDETRLRLHVFKRIGSLLLSDVRAQDVESILIAVQKTKAASTANRIRSVVSKVFSRAMELGLLQSNPCRYVRKLKEAAFRPRILTIEECCALLDELDKADNKYAAAALKVLILTGCRRSEVLNACWANFDAEAGTLFLPNTKSGYPRNLPLSEAAVAVIDSLDAVAGNPFIFPGRAEGKPVFDPRCTLQAALDKLGVPHLRIHDLRHSFATFAVNDGIDLYVIQKSLGHRSMATTQRYAHLRDSAVQRAATRVAEILSR